MDDRLLSARAALRADDPDAALEALRGTDGPHADWLRAVAAAAAGDPVRAQVALRAATRGGPLPPEALADVAGPFARAVLEDAPSAAAWRGLAVTVHHALGGGPVVGELHLAWELGVRAADAASGAERAELVVLLAGLKRAMGRLEEARDLARGAQEAARDADAPDVLAGATLLLAAICRDDGDPALAERVIAHGRRLLADSGRADLADELKERWASADTSPVC